MEAVLMFWVPGQPAIVSDYCVRPAAAVDAPMPAVAPPKEEGVDPKVVRDLVGLLLKATRKLPLDEPFREVVLDYLNRKDLQPSHLRDEASS
jgi:hypothetical protein